MDVTDPFTRRVAAGLGSQFVIERELGGGGMSRVFLARDIALDRPVVVKVQSVHGAINEDRFRREIMLAAQLQHPHVVPLLSAGSAEGLLFFTMPFVAGESLRTLIDRGGAIPIDRARVLLRDIARALGYAHGQGIVHRDIKPDNVLLSSDLAMVTDFGVAKALSSAREADDGGLTAVGTSLGTPAYIAPEQAAGDPSADHRADLYSFGALGYEVLTGQPPFAGRTPRAAIAAHIAEAPRPVGELRTDVPGDLAALVMACLEKEPSRRPQSATDIVTRLEAPQPEARPRRTRWLVATAVLAVTVGAVGWFAGRGRPSDGVDPRSIGVVPFRSLGNDNDYFADGMTEELIAALGRVAGLKVASRSSAFALKQDSGLDLKAIGQRLRVATVLEGSVRRAGDRVRLTAQLSDTRNGVVQWSETYERGVADLFAVQDELAGAIIGALEIKLSGQGVNRRGTADLAAYDAYLQGRHLWRQRTAPALSAAIEHFTRAIALDSGFARAWAGLADARVLLTLYRGGSLGGVADTVRGAASRALALDSTLAEAHATLGNLEKSLGNWSAGEAALRRAVAADSTDPSAWQWLGEILTFTGQLDEAHRVLARASALDSTAPMASAMLGYAAALAGHDSAARTAVGRAIRLAPQIWAVHVFDGAVALAGARPVDAAAAFARALPLASGPTADLVEALRLVARVAARDSGAAASARRFPEPEGGGARPALSLALAALAGGDPKASIGHLKRAVAERDAFLFASSLNAPWWDGLRQEQEFAEVARAMGLEATR